MFVNSEVVILQIAKSIALMTVFIICLTNLNFL